jgi:hypothetical protein
VTDYLKERWLQRRRRRGDAFTLQRFALFVAPEGLQAGAHQAASISPAVRTRQKFEQYLLRERGLAAASIRLYGDAVGRFLVHVFGGAEVRLYQLIATDVIGFVQVEAARLHHPKRAQVMTTALRSFLQYGRYSGDIVTDLHSCTRPFKPKLKIGEVTVSQDVAGPESARTYMVKIAVIQIFFCITFLPFLAWIQKFHGNFCLATLMHY